MILWVGKKELRFSLRNPRDYLELKKIWEKIHDIPRNSDFVIPGYPEIKSRPGERLQELLNPPPEVIGSVEKLKTMIPSLKDSETGVYLFIDDCTFCT